jgi:hypothetical protein
MYESLPVPFGLVRHGVAPDHPEVKVSYPIQHPVDQDTHSHDDRIVKISLMKLHHNPISHSLVMFLLAILATLRSIAQ